MAVTRGSRCPLSRRGGCRCSLGNRVYTASSSVPCVKCQHVRRTTDIRSISKPARACPPPLRRTPTGCKNCAGSRPWEQLPSACSCVAPSHPARWLHREAPAVANGPWLLGSELHLGLRVQTGVTGPGGHNANGWSVPAVDDRSSKLPRAKSGGSMTRAHRERALPPAAVSSQILLLFSRI